MYMSIHIDIKVEKNGIPKKLRRLASEMQNGFYSAFAKIAARLELEQKIMSPVDTGKLRASIEEKARAFGVDGIATAHSPTGYDYARINHDGGIGTGYYGPHAIPGRQYMTIPLQKSVPYVIKELDIEVKAIIARCGL